MLKGHAQRPIRKYAIGARLPISSFVCHIHTSNLSPQNHEGDSCLNARQCQPRGDCGTTGPRPAAPCPATTSPLPCRAATAAAVQSLVVFLLARSNEVSWID